MRDFCFDGILVFEVVIVKRWYVVQVYPGYEQRVKKDLVGLIAKESLSDSFGEILIPSSKVKGLFDSLQGETEQQLFPGYVLVEMELNQDAVGIVLACPQALRFLGGVNPIPLSAREVDRVRLQDKGEVPVITGKVEFEVGQEVEIVDGPFGGFLGIVDRVDKNAEKLTVMVSIFGRMTPVDLGFHQVKR